MCGFFFLSNSSFSGGMDRLLFWSLGVDGRCLKQRWWTRLPGVHAWLCVQLLPCRALWAQLLGWGQWSKVMLPEEHSKQSVHRAPDFRFLWCSLSFVLLLNFALPLEEFSLTFRGTGLVLFILRWLSSLCSHGHCFWRWSLDLSPCLLTNSVLVMWGGHN